MKPISIGTRRLLLSLLFALGLSTATLAESHDALAYMDSVEFSLITCSPHEEVYSLYGHTALRVHDLHHGKQGDATFNWGIFNFDAPHFVLRFVFGLTDYELGLSGFQQFCRYYRNWGSSVTEQVLNLTPAEKLQLNAALEQNYQPANRVYRYNIFYDNCSTRPRDMIERVVSGHISYSPRPDYTPTFRDIVRQKCRHHRWTAFGNDMLLGVRADVTLSRSEQEFLPENLLYDFDHAQIAGTDGTRRPLVKERRLSVPPGVQVVEPDFIVSPTEAATALLLLALLLGVAEWRRGRTFKYWDVLLMLPTGLAGCVLAVMLFSQHPTTSTNLQLLLVNPVHLFYIPSVLRRRPTAYWRLLPVMVLAFLAGSFFQNYAEGMVLLALCLLTRYVVHLKFRNEK